jgi:hypothetical protein
VQPLGLHCLSDRISVRAPPKLNICYCVNDELKATIQAKVESFRQVIVERRGGGVKASGGIRNFADTRAMLDAGASRIGTSASATILSAVDGVSAGPALNERR